jgi:hypothetical protein
MASPVFFRHQRGPEIKFLHWYRDGPGTELGFDNENGSSNVLLVAKEYEKLIV